MSFAVGVDGCKGGWVAAIRLPDAVSFSIHGDFASLVSAFPRDALIAVDIPVGLPERIVGKGRAAEKSVRPIMKGKTSSVFSMVARAAAEAEAGYRETIALARSLSDPPSGVSQQGYNILPKVREVDRLLRGRPDLVERVIETHPEVALCVINGMTPVLAKKKTQDGRMQRIKLLAGQGLHLRGPVSRARNDNCVAQPDDLIDAAICLMVAERILAGLARPFPSPPDVDACGLPIAIWA